MHRRTVTRLNANNKPVTTASHYRASHTRYINPSDMGLAAGNRFDAIFSATALKSATFASSPSGASSASAFSSLPEISEFVHQFTAGNTALHNVSGSLNHEHRHHGLEEAYTAITRAEEIFTSLIEHQLSEKTGVNSSSSTVSSTENGKVSASAVSPDIKMQFATIAATKIALLTNHFNHLGSGVSHAQSASANDSTSGQHRAPFTNISHPVMGGRCRIKVETEVILTAVKALALFEVPQRILDKIASSASSSTLSSLGPKAAAMFPFLADEASSVTGADCKDSSSSSPRTTDRDAPTHFGRSEFDDLMQTLTREAHNGGFMGGSMTRSTVASAQLLDSFSYLLSTLTYSLAKLKEIAPDSPLHFDGSQWTVFGPSAADLTKSDKALRDAMLNDSPKYFHLVQSFRLGDAGYLLKDVVRTYLNMGGSQTSVEARIPEISYAAASVASVLRSSCQQTASRLCVTSALLRILQDGNLVEAQKDILRGRKLLTMAYNNGREEELMTKQAAAAMAASPQLQAQHQNAAAHAILGQQLLQCPLSLLIGEFGQSLLFGDDAQLGKGSSLEGGVDMAPSGAVGTGNRNYGKMAGNDFSTVRHLHNRVNLFSMMSKREGNKRPLEGGLFLSLNAEICARKSYGTVGANEVDGILVELYNSSLEYYRTRVEDDSKSDLLALNASSVLTPEQKAALREQMAAEQDHYASALFAAGNFYLAGSVRPPPKTNKEQDRRIWESPHTQLAYLQTPIVGTTSGSDKLYTESAKASMAAVTHDGVASSAISTASLGGGAMGASDLPAELDFEHALKRAQQHLEKALQLTRSGASTTTTATNADGGVTNDAASNDSGSSVYNLKAAYILRSLACVYCEMKDYLYATGLFASAERAFVHHYGQNSAEVLDLLALQETYQRRIGAAREGEMTFKKMMNVVNERRKYGVL